jgi:hypothetical protein
MIRDILFWRGAVLGFLLPFLAFFLYANAIMEGDIVSLFVYLKKLGIHTHVMSLCVLANVLPFFLFVKKKRDAPAQGILFVTFLIVIFIFVNKLLF